MKKPFPKHKQDWQWFPEKKQPKFPSQTKTLKFTPTDISPEGFDFDLSWQTVPGASKVLVDEAELRIMPAVYNRSLGQIQSKAQGNVAFDLDLKADLVLKNLYLDLLKSDDITLAHDHDLGSRSWRLLCSAILDGNWVPLYAVPRLEKRGAVPAMLGGASFKNALLKLPGTVRARHWRIEVVEGNRIEDLVARAITLNRVSGRVTQAPQDLKVLGPENQELWSNQGPWQAPQASIALKVPLEQAFQNALESGATPLKTAYRLSGAKHSKVHILSRRVRGHLLREHAGVWEHRLEGEHAELIFDPALSSERAQSALTDLTVTYLGIRLLDLPLKTWQTQVPIEGRIVAGPPTLLKLPPRLFGSGDTGFSPARLGIHGRAVETCELVATFRDRTTGQVVGETAALEVEAGHAFQNHWFHFPEKPFETTIPQLEIRATRGRFYWAGGTLESLRFAVYDPNPAGRPLLLNGETLARMRKAKLHQPKTTLPTEEFATNPPRLSSHLFLKVELTDLQLRYAR